MHVHLSPDALRRLPGEEQRAFDVLKSLAEAGDIDAIRKVKGAAGVGNPAGAAPGSEHIGSHTLAKVAEHYAKLGMPLTPTGIRTFKQDRGLTGGTEIGPDTARAYARALDGKETLFRFPPGARLTPEQEGAREVFRQIHARYGTEGIARLKRKLGLGNPRTTEAGARLGNEYVGIQGLTRLAKAAKARGISLSPEGIRAFKREHQLGDDARIGPTTAERISSSLGVGERPADKAERIEWYRRLVESQGGTWRTGVNEVNAIGLRGFDVERGRNDNAFGRWNDTIAFVWKDERGQMQLREFRATTDPGQRRAADSPDVNRDGRGDVAHLRPGQYPYVLGSHKGRFGAGNPTYPLPVYRDTNHDGQIRDAEKRASERLDDRGYGINLHWGFGATSTVGGQSLGCQVIHGTRAQFLEEVTPILRRNRGRMLYTLVDMREVQ